jgi:putative transposase
MRTILSELHNRGVQDIRIAVVDGITGFPQAIEVAFPQTQGQTCIMHLPRHTRSFASYKDRKAVAAVVTVIYTASNAETAEVALATFEQSDLATKYPAITPS